MLWQDIIKIHDMTSNSFVGRCHELEILANAWNSRDPELIAVYGRRRVGKTELIRKGRDAHGFFVEFTGQRDATVNVQLLNFRNALSKALGITIQQPRNWTEAFSLLTNAIETRASSFKCMTLFFDEVSWLDSRRSGFLNALEYFWNHVASQNHKVKVVACGSSAAWVIKKIVQGKGGWHRRVTRKIHVKPFTLSEAAAFLKSRNLKYSHRDIIKLYAILGGIPYYLKMIDQGESLETLVERLLFGENAILRNEFSELFKSLFNNASEHQKIVETLAKRKSGYTRREISELSTIASGGGLSSYIENLEYSDFITAYLPLGANSKKETHYRLSDLFSLFYLKWIGRAKRTTWQSVIVSQAYKSWMGYAFEIIAWNHAEQLASYLGLKRIPWEATKAELTEDEEMAKIDLIIDVKGGSLYLIELKFYDHAYTITKTEAAHIERRRRVLAKHFNGNRSVIACLLAPQGVNESQINANIIDKFLPSDVLFEA